MRPSTLYFPQASLELSSSLDDLLVSKSRALILLSALFFVVTGAIIAGDSSTSRMGVLLAMCIGFGLVSGLAHRWVEERYLLAHIGWLAGLLTVILLAFLLMRIPEILLLAGLLPLIGAITLGFTTGAILEVVLIVLVCLLPAFFPTRVIPDVYRTMLPLFGAFSGLLGWITTNHLMTAVTWAMFNFKQARTNLQDACDQRLELQQTKEDLTKAYQELARLTDRLKALQRVAEEARQAKAEFVANVSHELRTPLNMIIGFTEIITSSPRLYGGNLPVSLMTDITAIQRNSKHLLHLVNDVLDLSQVESGRMALSRGWTDMNELIREAAAMVESLYQSKGLYLRLVFADNLPQVFCDRLRIRQVIINIVSNAGRFTQAGGVTITSELVEQQVQVTITDTGPGIPLDDQKRIFEPFQQLDNSIRRQHEGSGLGLTISKQFIEMHDGQLKLESSPGQGTTFTFSLPVSTPLLEENAFEDRSLRRGLIPGDEYGYTLRTRPSKASIPRFKSRLVVFEKEQSLQRVLSRYLTEAEVVAVSNTTDLANELNHSPAQAVIANTPPNEAISHQILSVAPLGTPVITCWLPGEVEAANQLGVVQYLMKPVTREKLLAAIEPEAISPEHPPEIKRILVVDDEPDELHLFVRMLESAGKEFQIVQVTNGKRALEAMRNRKIDLVLLDLVMPTMNGFQVLEARAKDPDLSEIPIIVISSRDPLGEAITSSALQISHSGGFTSSHLIEIIQSVARILMPEDPPRPHTPPA